MITCVSLHAAGSVCEHKWLARARKFIAWPGKPLLDACTVFFPHNLLLGHLLCKVCVVCVVIPIYTIVVISSYLARLHFISSASTRDHQRVYDFNSIIYLLDWIKRETGGKGSDTWLLKTSNYVCVKSLSCKIGGTCCLHCSLTVHIMLVTRYTAK